MARILITNNGTHSPEKWAMTTAEMVFPLEDTAMVGEHLIAAQKFQTQLAEVLCGHHGAVIEDEKEHMAAEAAHLKTPLVVSHYLDDAVADVVAAAKSTPWAAHFARHEVQSAIRDVIENHMMTAQHVERMWHAAHNESEHGAAYLALGPLTGNMISG